MTDTAPIAAGIDLGGSKIEAQIFAPDWTLADRRRIPTPAAYPDLVEAVASLVRWADAARPGLPVGLGAAGLVNPQTGLAFASNLPGTGMPFTADIACAAGRGLTHVNDARAFTLSEAVFGAARGLSPVVGVILGTGIGGGVVIGGRLVPGFSGLGGEIGHIAAAAPVVVEHDLPVIRCGCGRLGCYETLISGPGLARIALAVTGRTMTAPEIAEARATDPEAARIWRIWADLTAELLMGLLIAVDPAIFVLGGGLSTVPGIAEDLSAALARIRIGDFPLPAIVPAQGGETSGARGAAHAALQEAAP